MEDERTMETIIQTRDRAPISVVPMRNGGWLLSQGPSRLYVSTAELEAVLQHVKSATPAGVSPAKARLVRHVVSPLAEASPGYPDR